MDELERILDSETDLGCIVRKIQLRNGHYLIKKESIPEKVSLLSMPEIVLRKSVTNLVVIKGRIIIASAPYQPWVQQSVYEWNEAVGQQLRREKPIRCAEVVDPPLRSGDGVMYQSYNVGKVRVEGLDEELVIVRDIDILCSFDWKHQRKVQVSDFALTRGKVTC